MKVTSFTINHDKLLKGIYVSRKDKVAEDVTLTTFDIRIKKPNTEPCMDTAVMHTLEHLMAVYLRSHSNWADKVIYVGPMGCRTGMYLIFKGNLEPEDILPLMIETFEYIVSYDEEIPATTSKECGNYLDHNLEYTKFECREYLDLLKNIKRENMVYPM